MSSLNQTIADGQLAATATALTSRKLSGKHNISLQNVGGAGETVVLTLMVNGGTARRIGRWVLAANEQITVRGLALSGVDTLLGESSHTESMDFVIFSASEDTAFSTSSYDANGALKTAQLGVAGNLSIAGDLTVGGGDIDAGFSGSPGTVDIFPTTALSGKLRLAVADQTGDTTVTVTAAAMAAARSLSIPDPLAAADFLMGKQAAITRAATSDGLTTGTIADGGIRQHITVTSANANNIIVLPTPTPGTSIVLDVGATGFELRTSTPASIAINGGTGSAAESAIPASSTVFMTCVSATAWKGYFMDADGDLAKVEAAAP